MLRAALIRPPGDEDSYGDPGQYTHRTTFTLSPDADMASVLITGEWGSDNATTSDILLNGVSLGQANGGFNSLQPFGISSGLVIGVNTLDFVFRNDDGPGPGPTSLRVDGIASTYHVPEPATCVLALGLLGLGWHRRRRAC